MKKLFFIQLAVLAVLVTRQSVFAQEKEPQFGKDPVKDIVKKMTLDEKVRVVVGKGYNFPGMESNDRSPDKIPNIAGHTLAILKFVIPSISMADGPNGLHKPLTKQDSANNLYSTALLCRNTAGIQLGYGTGEKSGRSFRWGDQSLWNRFNPWLPVLISSATL